MLESVNRQEFLQATIQTKLLHWGVAALGVLILGIVFTGVLRSNLKSVQNKILDMKNKVAQATLASDAVEFENTLMQLHKELEKVKAKTLKSGEQAKVISLLTQVTEELGIAILNMKPQISKIETPVPGTLPPAAGQAFKAVPFEVEFESRYPALGVFFEKMEEAALLFSVNEFKSAPVEPNAVQLRTQLLFSAFEEVK